MKSIALCFLLLSCVCCVADDTNIIVMSDWSKPIALWDQNGHDQAIRGRLLIIEGDEPAYGGPKTEAHSMTFIELQNVTGANCGSIEVCFDVMGLNCELANTNNVPVALPPNHGGHDSRPFLPYWVALPYNPTIRLFVNSGYSSRLTIFHSGDPGSNWSISPKDTNVYYLSGTLNIFTPTNYAPSSFPEPLRQNFYDERCKGTLIFPKMKISAQ